MLAVKKNVTEMERLVEQAESDLGSVSTVKKVLNSVTLPSLFTPVTIALFLPYDIYNALQGQLSLSADGANVSWTILWGAVFIKGFVLNFNTVIFNIVKV